MSTYTQVYYNSLLDQGESSRTGSNAAVRAYFDTRGALSEKETAACTELTGQPIISTFSPVCIRLFPWPIW